MEVVVGIENIHRSFRNPVLTIGNFDGVHRGHQTLFARVKEWADRIGGESIVITFHPHPLQVLAPGNGPLFITPHERKLDLIEHSGIDVVIVIPFSREFAKLTARDFVRKILVETVGAKGIVVGYDYRFGHGREGDIEMLKKFGEEFGFQVDTVSGIEMDGLVVSSTAIRNLIGEGDLREASRLLGRPYEITGLVVEGRSRGGRLLGFPTANIRLASQARPKTGVYVVEVEVEGKVHGGAANLGYNPTFQNTELSLEVHIFDFNEDIYGKMITVRFIDRLRSEKRFASVEELAQQIQADVQKAREVLAERAGRSAE